MGTGLCHCHWTYGEKARTCYAPSCAWGKSTLSPPAGWFGSEVSFQIGIFWCIQELLSLFFLIIRLVDLPWLVLLVLFYSILR
jgi:hypothetical protein